MIRNPKVNQRVEILRKDLPACLFTPAILCGKRKLTGVIARINGGYIYVRPHWRKKNFTLELYDVELKAI